MDRSKRQQRPRGEHFGGSLSSRLHVPRRSNHAYIPKSTAERHHHTEHVATPVAPSPQPQPEPILQPPVTQVKAQEPTTPVSHPKPKQRQNLALVILKKIPWRKPAACVVALALVVVVISGFWATFKFLRATDKVFGGSIFGNIGDLLGTQSVTVNGQSSGRINILLAGDSLTNDKHDPGSAATDTIIVASFDIKNNTAFLLSIPKDLWINIGGTSHKINLANTNSKFSQLNYPKGGMGQLQELVQDDLGIPIDYYALVNYAGFKDVVNDVNGVTVNIQGNDPRGLSDAYTNLNLPNGEDNLDGQEALDLARAYGDSADGDVSYGFAQNGDYNRTVNQRELLVAIKNKATSAGVVSNPLKIGQLFDDIGNNVQTDMSLADLLKIDQLIKPINSNNVASLTYSDSGTRPLLTSYTTPDGENALIPTAGQTDFTDIQHYYQQQVSSNAVVKEYATVAILNGTTTNGLATTAKTLLETKGADVTSTADASHIYPVSTIINNSGGNDPATLTLLENIYGINVTSQQLESAPGSPDFIVVIGGNSVPTLINSSQ